MRRRILLESVEDNYIFSASTTSPQADTDETSKFVGITSTTKTSENVTYEVMSYETPIYSVSIGTYGITIRFNKSSSVYSKSATVILKQAESNKLIEITLTQKALTPTLNYRCLIVNDNSSSRAAAKINVTDDGTVTSSPSWANVTYADGFICVTATSINSSSSTRIGEATISIGSYAISFYVAQFPSGYINKDYETIGGINWSVKNVNNSSSWSYGTDCLYEYGAGAQVRQGSTYHDTWYTGTENPLASSADTATQVLGSRWRMPTSAECQTLISNTTYYWSRYGGYVSSSYVYGGKDGGLFISSTKTLYIPSGYSGWGSHSNSYGAIWTSTPYSTTRDAYCLKFSQSNRPYVTTDYRQGGFCVMGVYN